MTTREPRWTAQDRAEQLALAVYRASLCPCGCGYSTAETTAHHTLGPEYDATKVSCRARVALIDAQRAAAEANKGEPASWLWTISETRKG